MAIVNSERRDRRPAPALKIIPAVLLLLSLLAGIMVVYLQWWAGTAEDILKESEQSRDRESINRAVDKALLLSAIRQHLVLTDGQFASLESSLYFGDFNFYTPDSITVKRQNDDPSQSVLPNPNQIHIWPGHSCLEEVSPIGLNPDYQSVIQKAAATEVNSYAMVTHGYGYSVRPQIDCSDPYIYYRQPANLVW